MPRDDVSRPASICLTAHVCAPACVLSGPGTRRRSPRNSLSGSRLGLMASRLCRESALPPHGLINGTRSALYRLVLRLVVERATAFGLIIGPRYWPTGSAPAGAATRSRGLRTAAPLLGRGPPGPERADLDSFRYLRFDSCTMVPCLIPWLFRRYEGIPLDHDRPALRSFVGSLVACFVGDRTGDGRADGTYFGGMGNVQSKLRPGCSSRIGGAFDAGGAAIDNARDK